MKRRNGISGGWRTAADRGPETACWQRSRLGKTQMVKESQPWKHGLNGSCDTQEYHCSIWLPSVPQSCPIIFLYHVYLFNFYLPRVHFLKNKSGHVMFCNHLLFLLEASVAPSANQG